MKKTWGKFAARVGAADTDSGIDFDGGGFSLLGLGFQSVVLKAMCNDQGCTSRFGFLFHGFQEPADH